MTEQAAAPSTPTPPAPAQVGKGETLVKTRPGYEFDSGVDGVPTITPTGVLVSKTLATKVADAAEANGVEVFIEEGK